MTPIIDKLLINAVTIRIEQLYKTLLYQHAVPWSFIQTRVPKGLFKVRGWTPSSTKVG